MQDLLGLSLKFHPINRTALSKNELICADDKLASIVQKYYVEMYGCKLKEGLTSEKIIENLTGIYAEQLLRKFRDNLDEYSLVLSKNIKNASDYYTSTMITLAIFNFDIFLDSLETYSENHEDIFDVIAKMYQYEVLHHSSSLNSKTF